MIKFEKTVSKGSKFNQIYIPKNIENLIEVGDKVEVKLIEKHTKLHYSKSLKDLSEFKKNLIENIFSFLNKDNIKQIFIVGSFLTEKINYNDIDVVLITKKISKKLEHSIYKKLIEKFNLKFHLLFIEEKEFINLLNICPLTKSMFTISISNKKIINQNEKVINKNHIKFLLMMPYDLLEIKLSSRNFFNSLRRLITIEKFLKNKSLNTKEINRELKILIKEILYHRIKNDEEIESNSIIFLRKIIKSKLKVIENLIKNGEK